LRSIVRIFADGKNEVRSAGTRDYYSP